ncbi:MAG: hypothetical protein DRI57_14230 [Deltaproteobacteria bacterium]|nr:MAG: hypothetical protein DRI57_14230 [Deltaproteobacteria bacterium]
MKKTIFCIAVLLGVFLFTGGPLSGAGNLKPIENVADLNHKSGKFGKYHALLIGINEYDDPLFLRPHRHATSEVHGGRMLLFSEQAGKRRRAGGLPLRVTNSL